MIDFIEQNKRVYDSIATFFSGTRAWLWDDMRLLEPYIHDGDAILDLGCGNGRLYQLCRTKPAAYTGIDQSDELIRIAREKFPDANFVAGSMTKLPFAEKSFDKVFSIAAFHHLPDVTTRVETLQEIKRVLKPGGIVIFLNWNLLGEWGKAKLQKGDIRLVDGMDNDFLVPWKDPTGHAMGDRFYHGFTDNELRQLCESAGFNVVEMHYLKKGKPSDARSGENLWTLLTT